MAFSISLDLGKARRALPHKIGTLPRILLLERTKLIARVDPPLFALSRALPLGRKGAGRGGRPTVQISAVASRRAAVETNKRGPSRHNCRHRGHG